MSPKGSAPASSRVANSPQKVGPNGPRLAVIGGVANVLIHQNFVNRFEGRASYLPEMPEPKVYEFSKHICALCATRGTDVFRLGTKLGIDPMELLQMINGKVVPTRAVISGLAKELDSNVSLLTKEAAEIKP
jgi:hypothetical protein